MRLCLPIVVLAVVTTFDSHYLARCNFGNRRLVVFWQSPTAILAVLAWAWRNRFDNYHVDCFRFAWCLISLISIVLTVVVLPIVVFNGWRLESLILLTFWRSSFEHDRLISVVATIVTLAFGSH